MNFRVWRVADMKHDYYKVGEFAECREGDVIQLGSGFKDKSGTEVFDGDVVTGDSSGTLDNVVFSCGCFCLERAMMHYEATYWGNEIEVVGHIYDGKYYGI